MLRAQLRRAESVSMTDLFMHNENSSRGPTPDCRNDHRFWDRQDARPLRQAHENGNSNDLFSKADHIRIGTRKGNTGAKKFTAQKEERVGIEYDEETKLNYDNKLRPNMFLVLDEQSWQSHRP